MENPYESPQSLEKTVEKESEKIQQSNRLTFIEYGAIIAIIGIVYSLITENVLDDLNWAYENILNLGRYIGSYFY